MIRQVLPGGPSNRAAPSLCRKGGVISKSAAYKPVGTWNQQDRKVTLKAGTVATSMQWYVASFTSPQLEG
jgi:hypothetical protein